MCSVLPSALLALLDKYAVRFIPHENGVHTIDVKFNGSHVVGSPFKVRVGEPGQAGNPALVSAYGAGLEGGTTGKSQMAVFWPCPHCPRDTGTMYLHCGGSYTSLQFVVFQLSSLTKFLNVKAGMLAVRNVAVSFRGLLCLCRLPCACHGPPGRSPTC